MHAKKRLSDDTDREDTSNKVKNLREELAVFKEILVENEAKILSVLLL